MARAGFAGRRRKSVPEYLYSSGTLGFFGAERHIGSSLYYYYYRAGPERLTLVILMHNIMHNTMQMWFDFQHYSQIGNIIYIAKPLNFECFLLLECSCYLKNNEIDLKILRK